MNFEYNTRKPHLVLREYGRNIQKLVEFIKTIEDQEKRNAYASTLVSLMRQVSPSSRESNETEQKLWDDLFIMANFELDIDSPYPKPEPEILTKKPMPLSYSANDIKYKHYGKNIELLVEKAIELEDEEEREAAIIYIGKLMKSFYNSWNKENIEDESIIRNIKELSGGKLHIDLNKVKENNLFETLYKERKRSRGGGRRGSKSGKRKRN